MFDNLGVNRPFLGHFLGYSTFLIHFFNFVTLPLQGEEGVKEADGSKENGEDQPSEDQRETSG